MMSDPYDKLRQLESRAKCAYIECGRKSRHCTSGVQSTDSDLSRHSYKIMRGEQNGKKLLALDFKTFLNLLVLIITKATNVAHPSLEVVKAELAKITTSEDLVQKNPILKTTFLVA
ncbi:hypothetical protein Tco_0470676 [Tanacetum coccineum]